MTSPNTTFKCSPEVKELWGQIMKKLSAIKKAQSNPDPDSKFSTEANHVFAVSIFIFEKMAMFLLEKLAYLCI